MKILKNAQAGSFESSDIMILIEPISEKSGRNIEIDSSVMSEYGGQIKSLIERTLDEYEIENIHLIARDKGALAQTITARLETAIKRSINEQKGTLIN